MKGMFVKLGIGTAMAVSFAVAVAAVTPTQADGDNKGNSSISKAEMMAKSSARFDQMDANRDGRIDAADRDARLKSRFASIDTDKNGSLSETEFAAAHAGRDGMHAMGGERRHERGGHNGRRAHHDGGMLRAADSDGDGVITRAEMIAGANAHFVKMESNGDGQISRAEREAVARPMRGQHRGPSKD